MKKVIKYILLIIMISSLNKVTAKELVEEYIDLNNEYIYTNTIFVKTADNSFITFDTPYYAGTVIGEPFVIQKIDMYGNVVWKRKYDDLGGDIYSGIELSNNDIVLAGTIRNNENDNQDGLVLIFDEEGNIKKKHIFSGERNIEFRTVLEDNNKNLILVGDSNSQNYFNINNNKRFGIVIKIKVDGTIIKKETIENEYDLYVERAVKTKNNNYIVKAYENLYTFKDDISEITLLDIDLDMDEYITSQIFESKKNGFYLFILKHYSDLDSYATNITYISDAGEIIKEQEFDYEDISWISNIVETPDNGYLLYVNNDSMPELEYKKMIKMDSDFNAIWEEQESYSETGDISNCIYIIDNNYIILNPGFDFTINIYEENGNKLYNKTIEMYKYDAAEYIDGFLEGDDTFVAVGEDYNYEGIFGVLIKYNQSGDVLFKKDIKKCYYKRIIPTDDLGYLTLGYSYNSDVYPFEGQMITKFNNEGEILWYKNQESIGLDSISSIYQKNNEYLIIGYKNSSPEDYNSKIVKLDKDGNVIWNKDYILDYNSSFQEVLQLDNNRIIVSGRTYINYYTYGNSFIIEYDNSGNIISDNFFEIGEGYIKSLKNYDNNHYIIIKAITDGYADKLYTYMMDYNNNIIWEKEYISNLLQYFNVSVHNKKIFIIGSWFGAYSSSPIQNENILISYNESGELLLNRSIDNPYNEKYDGMHFEPNALLDVYSFTDGSIRILGCTNPMEITGYPFLYDIYYRYDITSKSSKNGTFIVDKKTAKNKEIITINAKPKLGYIVDKIILTDTKGNKIELHELTFEMIPDDVEVEVVFRELINPKTGFSILSIITMITGLILITIKSKKKTLTN